MSYILKILLPFSALILLIIAIVFAFSHPEGKEFPSSHSPAISPFKNSIAGIGIVEPQSGIVDISPKVPGTITKMYVQVGQQVKVDQFLFKLDDAEMQAQVNLAKVQLQSARTAYDDVPDGSPNRVVRAAQAKINEAKANLNLAETRLNNLTVKSPINGVVLKINVKQGEMSSGAPVILLGNSDNLMWVRVEIDETNAGQFYANARASGVIRGLSSEPIELKFVRAEPFVQPKKTLSGRGNEIIDTRVMQIIYSFDKKNRNIHVGQQMDVYIDSNNLSNKDTHAK